MDEKDGVNRGRTLLLHGIVNKENPTEILPVLPENYVKGYTYNDYLTKTKLKNENNFPVDKK